MTGLVVSVQDVAELRHVLSAGVSMIDIKEPALGSLGRAPDSIREAILNSVNGLIPVSAALGELLDEPRIPTDLSRLSYVKFGLAGCRNLDWRGLLKQVRVQVEQEPPCQLVVAGYADWRKANSPPPSEVCLHAIEQHAAILLFDTWHKDGTTLLDWMPVEGVADLVHRCKTNGVQVALAGSLGVTEIAALRAISADWVAVRGAVCHGGARSGEIDPVRVRGLVSLLHQNEMQGGR